MTKAKAKKPLPSFASEDEEREFWDNHDTDDYFGDDGELVMVPSPSFIRKQKTLPWLKLLLDKQTMARLCAVAIERGESHHELGNQWLRERLDQEIEGSHEKGPKKARRLGGIVLVKRGEGVWEDS